MRCTAPLMLTRSQINVVDADTGRTSCSPTAAAATSHPVSSARISRHLPCLCRAIHLATSTSACSCGDCHSSTAADAQGSSRICAPPITTQLDATSTTTRQPTTATYTNSSLAAGNTRTHLLDATATSLPSTITSTKVVFRDGSSRLPSAVVDAD